jgi:hypothetical protein
MEKLALLLVLLALGEALTISLKINYETLLGSLLKFIFVFGPILLFLQKDNNLVDYNSATILSSLYMLNLLVVTKIIKYFKK